MNANVLLGVIWLAAVVTCIWLIVALFPKPDGNLESKPDKEDNDSAGSALQILNKRYALGELSKEQFEEMRRALEK